MPLHDLPSHYSLRILLFYQFFLWNCVGEEEKLKVKEKPYLRIFHYRADKIESIVVVLKEMCVDQMRNMHSH